MTIPVAFQGEVMLAGWSQTHNGGAKVTFWLQDDTDLEAFKAMTVAKGKTAGQRLALVAVEIGDDEQLKPVMGNPMTVAPDKTKGEKLAWLAIQLCKNPHFWDFAGVSNEINAREWLLAMCGGINSRSDLDTDEEAADLFHANVRKPFREWMGSRK
ncbi:hypothetical protein MyNCGM121_41800 [Achromobacter xylosoxidans]